VSLEYGSVLRIELTVVARQAEIYDRFLSRLEASRRFADLAFGTEARAGEMKAVVHALYVTEEGS
jgi:hypothetical protein